jgi:hypothetical protein
MGEVVVWWVRLVFAVILIGALASAVAFLLLIGGIGGDLRHLLGSVAVWCFYSLLLLGAGMLVLSVGNRMSQRFRNWLHGQR